jgi:hypothetical protein
MRQAKYVWAGTTNDETCLKEIQRDYLANENVEMIAFTRLNQSSSVTYWVEYKQVIVW